MPSQHTPLRKRKIDKSGPSPALGFDGTSGALKSQVQLPQSTTTVDFTLCNSSITTTSSPGVYSDPIVGPDGAVYMQSSTSQTYEARTPAQFCLGINVFQQTNALKLLKNGVAYQTIASSTNSSGQATSYYPSSTIPDGNGGMLVSYTERSGDGSTVKTMIADTIGASATTAISPQYAPWPTTMVLGDNNAAFITDGSVVESFNTSTLTQNWAYTSTSGGNISFISATSGGGVSVNDSLQGVIQLDSNGNASSPVASLQGTAYFGNSQWVGVSSDPVLEEIQGGYLTWANNIFSMPFGDKASQSKPPSADFELDRCIQGVCSSKRDPDPTNPIQDQDVVFSIQAADPPHGTVNLTNQQIQQMEVTAGAAFMLAFRQYNVNVGMGRQGTNTVYVVGQGNINCGGTGTLAVSESVVYYPSNATQAQYAIHDAAGAPTQALIQAIGRGVGNNAAHEIAHELMNRYLASGNCPSHGPRRS